MDLAIVGTRGIPARYGGFETFAEELAVRLTERGVKVTVFCEHRPPAGPDTYRGVRLIYLPVIRAGAVSPVLSDAWALWLARHSYDVIYVLGYAAPIFFWLPRIFGRKVWVNMDGIEWARRKWGRIGRAFLRAMESVAAYTANRIIADAHEIKAFLLQRHPNMVPCSVIAYGAPIVEQAPQIRALSDWGVEPYSYYLLVARLEPENHILEIVKGFARSSSASVLIVVGDNHSKTSYVTTLVAMASERVRFVGAIYDSHKLQALRYYAKAYFHGHSVGGTNPSLLEALGCGNPVIAHDNPFNREVCGEHALYFANPTDIPELVRKVDSYDQPRRAEISERARRIVAQRYSWDLVADAYYQLLVEETSPSR